MQVTETKAEGLERAYRAVAMADEIAAKVDEKIEEVRPTAQLKGFRKGKAPRSLLKKMFGKSVLGEVMQELVDGAVNDHIRGAGHRPTAQPKVEIVNENYQEGDDLQVDFAYELLPDVPEMAFGELKLERLRVRVDDDAVDAALSRLAEQAVTFVEKDGAADAGDQVVIDFIGRIDGVAFDGGAGEDFPLTLGSGQFIPGFEDQLIGASAGDGKTVTTQFPEDYGAAELAGKSADFEVTVKEVRAPKAAEIDDALAEKFGDANLEELKTKVRNRIADEYRGAARSILKRRLLDALNETVSFDLPPSMVAEEAGSIAHQLWRDENPDADAESQEAIEPNDEHRSLAERRVKLGILLADIGAKAEVQVTDAEIDKAIVQQAQRFGPRAREYYDFASKNPQMRAQFRSPIFEDKVVDYVIELADVSEREVGEDELKAELKSIDGEEGDETSNAETS